MKEKYAVVLDDELTKTGSTDATCPGCGGPRQVPCKNCGTEPFEKKPEQKKPAPK